MVNRMIRDDASRTAVVRAIRESARDTLGYARRVLCEWRHVSRGPMTAAQYQADGNAARAACYALAVVCRELAGSEFGRLATILEWHGARFGRAFK